VWEEAISSDQTQNLVHPSLFKRFTMSEAITPAVSDRICKHMNDDHADAVLVYAQVFGKTQAATAARMESIDLGGDDPGGRSGGTTGARADRV
jgi:putative heme iron utilization protein